MTTAHEPDSLEWVPMSPITPLSLDRVFPASVHESF